MSIFMPLEMEYTTRRFRYIKAGSLITRRLTKAPGDTKSAAASRLSRISVAAVFRLAIAAGIATIKAPYIQAEQTKICRCTSAGF